MLKKQNFWALGAGYVLAAIVLSLYALFISSASAVEVDPPVGEVVKLVQPIETVLSIDPRKYVHVNEQGVKFCFNSGEFVKCVLINHERIQELKEKSQASGNVPGVSHRMDIQR